MTEHSYVILCNVTQSNWEFNNAECFTESCIKIKINFLINHKKCKNENLS